MEKILCLIETNWTEDLEWYSSQEFCLNNKPYTRWNTMKQEITPLIDHPHSDKENGQNEIHYHADTRYMKNVNLNVRVSLPLKSNQKLEYRYLFSGYILRPFRIIFSASSAPFVKSKFQARLLY